MANVRLRICPEDDPLGTPVETWTDNDILDLKLDISLYDLGRNTVRIPRKTWEASVLKAHTDGTYYARVDIDYIDGTNAFWGFWLVSGEFVLTDPNEQGGEDVTIGGPGPMWYLTKARLNYREYSSHSDVYVEDERWHFDGLTYGHILDVLIDEDQASPRQALPDLDTPGWGAVNDADGNPWEDFPGIFSVDMGTDYLSVLRELQKADHLYAWLTPEAFNLRAVKQYGDDHSGAAFGAGVVRFVKGVNIVGQLRRNSEKGPLYTHVLAVGNDKVLANGHVVEGQPIHVWVVSDDYSPGDAIRQGFLSYDTNSEEVLERRAKRFIRRSKDRSESLVRFEIMPGDDESAGLYLPGRPSSDRGKFWIGDTITIDTGGGNDLDFNERDIAVAKIGIELGPAVREDTDQGSERSWRVFVETGDDVRPSASADSAASTGAQTVRRCRCRRPTPFCTPVPDDAVESEISNSTDNPSDWPGSTSTGDACWGGLQHEAMGASGGQTSLFTVAAGDFVYARLHFMEETGDDSWENVSNYAYVADLEFSDVGNTLPVIKHSIVAQLYHNVGCINVEHDTVAEVPTGYNRARVWFRFKLGGMRYRGWIGTLETEEGIDCPPFSLDESLPHESPYYVPSDTFEYLLENHTHDQGVIEDSITNETDTSLVLAPDGAGGVEFVSGGGGGGAPSSADYLVGTANGSLSAEIVVGTTPGGELGGTWASPTVDATHSGSAHHNENHASRHADGGADAVDVTDLDGFTGSTTDFLRADGTFVTPPGGAGNESWEDVVSDLSGKVHRWKFGEGSGDFNDEIGTLDLIANGSISYGVASPLGDAVSFTGGYAESSGLGSIPTGANERTILIVYRKTTRSGGSNVPLFSYGAATTRQLFQVHSVNILNVQLNTVNVNTGVGMAFGDGEWHMVAATYLGSGHTAQSLYADGTQAVSLTTGGDLNTSTANNFHVAAEYDDTDPAAITVTDCIVFNRHLPKWELDRLYRALTRELS